MPSITPILHGPIAVSAYVCTDTAVMPPLAEQHQAWSVSYVHAGSFGCTCRGRRFELVPGSVLLGRPGDEYTCSHDHHRGGDACLAFFIDPALREEVGGRHGAWQSCALPPIAELIALGELARSAARRPDGPRVAEVGMALAAKVTDLLAGQSRARTVPSPADRRRAVESALWIEAHSAQAVDLAWLAGQAGWSLYHYLRQFSAVLGASPYQYLLRCRLRHAAGLLADGERSITAIALDVGFADLSNFVRSFHRAAGVSPRAYRRKAHGERKILQEPAPVDA